MTKFEAVTAIIADQFLRRRKATDYRRMRRALLTLELSADEINKALKQAEYHTHDDQPYPWAVA